MPLALFYSRRGPRFGRARRGPAAAAMLCLTIAAIALAAAATPAYTAIRNTTYDRARERGRRAVLAATAGYEVMRSANFEIRFDPRDAAWAPVVLRIAEEAAPALGRSLGLEVPRLRERFGGAPPLMVMFPTREALSASCGWPATENAMGAYWAGVVRLLSPTQWIRAASPEEAEEALRREGPVVHELAHLVLDYLGEGNYPRWFTEGIAQLEEWRITGFVWIEDGGRRLLDSRYGLDALTGRFDSLPDQALAYRESLLLTAFLDELAAESGGVRGIMASLAARPDFWGAIEDRTGLKRKAIEAAFAAWLPANIARWNPLPATSVE
jgi:hypothetical protein